MMNCCDRHSGEGRNPETLSLNPWIPACAGVTTTDMAVIPAKAGIQRP